MQFNIIAEDEEPINIKYFLEASASDFSFSSDDFKIKYIDKCHQKCATCGQLGSDSNYSCVKCNSGYPFKINDRQICQDFCTNFIRKDEQRVFACSDSCEENEYIYNRSENEVYCLFSCSYDGEELYQDESEIIYYKSCFEASNGNNKLYENKCMSVCPEDCISNENNICTKEIKDSIIFNTEYSLSPNPNSN